MNKLFFRDIDAKLPPSSGIYEIHTNSGHALKVGIGKDLLKRLKAHRASRDSGLRLKSGGDRNNPRDVESKSSILAKHLYYDRTISERYNLQTELGRRAFLADECYILFATTKTKEEARMIEISRERDLVFRYLGHVVIR